MSHREYPAHPLVGVGGVVIRHDRALLVRRDTQPARGEWTIPGGLLETGETLADAVVRELREETGVTVRVVDLIEALERIFYDDGRGEPAGRSGRGEPTVELSTRALGGPVREGASGDTEVWDTRPQASSASRATTEETTEAAAAANERRGPKYHYVILDYLCELMDGEPTAIEEISDVAWVAEEEMESYKLTPAATRVLLKGFAMARNTPPKLAK